MSTGDREGVHLFLTSLFTVRTSPTPQIPRLPTFSSLSLLLFSLPIPPTLHSLTTHLSPLLSTPVTTQLIITNYQSITTIQTKSPSKVNKTKPIQPTSNTDNTTQVRIAYLTKITLLTKQSLLRDAKIQNYHYS